MHKIKHNLFESCLKDLFSAVNDNYNLRSQSDFRVPGINTVFYGVNSIRYSGSVICNSLPNDLRNICDFDLFKTTIHKWKPVDCPCRLEDLPRGPWFHYCFKLIVPDSLCKFYLLCFVKIEFQF